MGAVSRSRSRSNHQLVTLIFIHLKVRFFKIKEGLKTLFLYYPNPRFLWSDLLLKGFYWKKSPYRIAKGISLYGETPLTTLDRVATECRILSEDTFYDLGCGTGRCLFWLTAFIGCKAVGIEKIPSFTSKGEKIKKWTKNERVTFKQENLSEVSLEKATVLYLYVDEKTSAHLSKRFASLKKGTRIITVSAPLQGPNFHTTKEFRVKFPWGSTFCYLNLVC